MCTVGTGPRIFRKGRSMRELTIRELESVRGGSEPPGQLGYEGQPGNQGGNNQAGQQGYEGQPGNQSNG